MRALQIKLRGYLFQVPRGTPWGSEATAGASLEVGRCATVPFSHGGCRALAAAIIRPAPSQHTVTAWLTL